MLKKIFKITQKKIFLVVILGPDGAGKSTLIKGLIKEYDDYGVNYYSHLYPKLNKFKGFGKLNYPYKKKPYPIFISDLKIIYMLLRHIISALIICINSKKEKSIIWCDRYLYDIFADPHRYRIKNTFFNYQFIRHISWKPDIIIILNPPLNSILKRSSELEESELRLQIKSYNKLKAILKDSLLISSENKIEETIVKSKNYIDKFLYGKK